MLYRPGQAADGQRTLSIGLVTDLHFADKATAGTRHYRETPGKLKEAASAYANQSLDMLVELGDLIDAASDVPTELGYLETINEQFAAICPDRHYVLGNHCVDTLKKSEFLSAVGKKDSYYAFDRGNFHFVVLDSCFRQDGTPYQRKNFTWTDANVPPAELEWLTDDLAKNTKPTIVFAHQRLDTDDNHGVRNNAAVRKVLEQSGHVAAVFQGHSHKNDLREINSIHYCTLRAMVEGTGAENNGYSLLNLFSNGDLELTGFRKQESYQWPSPESKG